MKPDELYARHIYKGQMKGKHAHYIYPKVAIFERMRNKDCDEPWLPYCSLCGGWTFKNPVPDICEYCGATMDEGETA